MAVERRQSQGPATLAYLRSRNAELEARLAESEAAGRQFEALWTRLDGLLERLDEGVVAATRKLEIEFANAAAERMFGGPLQTGRALPEPWEEISLGRLVTAAFEQGAEQLERLVSPDREHTYSVVVVPARTAGTALLILRDVTARERRELAQRDFVTNAAHELRTPLAAITSAIEVLQDGAKEAPDQRDLFLGHIQRETGRLTRLARGLLALARVQTGRESPREELIDISALLQDVADGLSPKPGVAVQVDCPPGLALIANRDLSEQAVVNLAGNAARYTRQGWIRLSAEPVEENLLALVVEDTGPGIDASEQERVFDRFYRGGGRREAEGASFGLGLAIVLQTVEALGSHLELQSEPGRGTRATIVLPNRGRITN